jgi:hypothetical protein
MTAGLAEKMQKVSKATKVYNDELKNNEAAYKALERASKAAGTTAETATKRRIAAEDKAAKKLK